MKLKTVLFAAAATVATAPAAYAYEGLYGAIGAGLSYVGPDRDLESEFNSLLRFDSEADYDNGIGVYTALGYAFDNNVRGELEFSYRDNDIRHWAGDGLGFSGFPTQLDGGVRSQSFLANVLYDFNNTSRVTPYVGVGVGGSRMRFEFNGLNGGAVGGPLSVAVDDTSYKLAYQGIAGLAFELAENLSLDLSYRYFSVLNPEFDGLLNGVPTNFETDYNSHSAFAGLRWNFGPAPAPTPEYKDCWDGSSVPISANCPPQIIEDTVDVIDPLNFVVYFDYDKSNLTPEAANLISEASARALENEIETVVVSGNTDTSGSSAYNQALSERRAAVVREALIANGVPADRVVTEAYGETNLAKPTPDGVREPLNRRSEVVISFF